MKQMDKRHNDNTMELIMDQITKLKLDMKASWVSTDIKIGLVQDRAEFIIRQLKDLREEK